MHIVARSDTLLKFAEKIYRGKKYRLEIHRDEGGDSPRDWDNLVTMYFWHDRYRLGDNNPFDRPSQFAEDVKPLVASHDIYMKSIFMYDHSGITISTKPFGCMFDSGQVGYVWVTRAKLRKEIKDFKDEDFAKVADKIIEQEIKVYDQYLQGEVYGYIAMVLKKCDMGEWHELREEEESCWGYYDIKHMDVPKTHKSLIKKLEDC